jgi:glycosyltransferase involved in cell wall biosynthesis
VSQLISPVVLTFNEAPNLGRTLEAVAWAREVVVLDSFSTDATMSIARKFANVRVLQRTFDTHADQWQAAVAACATDWILGLDSDYVLSTEIIGELQGWEPTADVDAYFCRFRYCVEGAPLRASLYPPRAILFNRQRCEYVQDGHTQVLSVRGRTGWLNGAIFHDDRKPLSRWMADQDRYARLEARKLMLAPTSALSWQDRCRRLIVAAPALVFFGTLFVKGVILDGWRGWFYTCQRTIAELMLSLRLVEARFKTGDGRT